MSFYMQLLIKGRAAAAVADPKARGVCSLDCQSSSLGGFRCAVVAEPAHDHNVPNSLTEGDPPSRRRDGPRAKKAETGGFRCVCAFENIILAPLPHGNTNLHCNTNKNPGNHTHVLRANTATFLLRQV